MFFVHEQLNDKWIVEVEVFVVLGSLTPFEVTR